MASTTPREDYLAADRKAWDHYRSCSECLSALGDPARLANLCPEGEALTDVSTDLWIAQLNK